MTVPNDGSVTMTDLDQALMSAATAMSFALAHWDAYCVFTAGVIGDEVPVTKMGMSVHANVLLGLINLERLPK